jgi:hypothetical protein
MSLASLAVGQSTPPGLDDLGTVEELRTRFEADGGSTRLVLLLSPT